MTVTPGSEWWRVGVPRTTGNGDSLTYTTSVDLTPPDLVNEPPHYQDAIKCPHCHKGIEAIHITEQFPGNLAAALKYILRHTRKGKPIQDLRKSSWYTAREADRLEANGTKGAS